MAVRNQFTNLITKDMNLWYLESYDRFSPVYPQIFEVRTMTGAYESSTSGLGLGKLTERPEGNDIVASNLVEGYTVLCKARTWSGSYDMSFEFVEDTPPEKISNILRAYAATWGEGVVATKEQFAAGFFNYGFYTAGYDSIFDNTVTGTGGIVDSSGDLIYDGKPFFAASGNNHPAKDGSTYYNSLGTANLNETNLKTMHTLMTVTNNRNERGEIVQIMPDTLLIPGNLHFTAKTLLESENVVGSANNDRNPVQNIVQPIEWQYLTDTDAWFLGARGKGLVWYERMAPAIDFYQDEDNDKYVAKINSRFGAVVENWRFWAGANGSTS